MQVVLSDRWLSLDAPALFIADLHLQASRPATLERALALLTDSVGQMRHLFIVGDLVEYWLGDDTPEQALTPVFDAIRQLADRGTTVHLMHGNRDFLLGDRIAERLGATLHREDVLKLNLGERRTLLCHGDTLCTDDVDYLALRAQLRDPHFQQQFLTLPLQARMAEAEKLRATSAAALAGKQAEIMDANDVAIESLLEEHQAEWLIHGHTHRPAVHEHRLADGRPATRYVLGDWRADGAEILRWDGMVATLEQVQV